jgi:hypothetical protein
MHVPFADECQGKQTTTWAKRANDKDPNFAALRYYIQHGRHMASLNRCERNVIYKQAEIYKLNEEGRFEHKQDGKTCIYLEEPGARNEVLKAVHEYVYNEHTLFFILLTKSNLKYHKIAVFVFRQYNHCRRDHMLRFVMEKHYWKGVKGDIETYVSKRKLHTGSMGPMPGPMVIDEI